MNITRDELERKCTSLMLAVGTPEDNARLVSETLVSADMRGISSHGVMRISNYMRCILSGGLHPAAKMEILGEGPAYVHVSACGGLGIPAACRTTDLVIAKAASCPLVAGAVCHSDHYGAAGYYAMKCAEKGLIGFSMSNTCPLIAVTGASSAAIGNNPFAYAAPAGKYRAILFDICMSVVASGKIQIASAQHQPIPDGWILDRTGNPTHDPDEVFKGAIFLPFAGHKGYGFAMMVELLAGVLSGAGVLGDVHSWNKQPGRDSNTGHFFMAINPAFFGGLEAFVARTGSMIEHIKAARKAPGIQEILYPGELEFARERKALESGIELPEASVIELEKAEEMVKNIKGVK